jgi:hypothetical protein
MKSDLRIKLSKQLEHAKKNGDSRYGIVVSVATFLLALLFLWNIAETNLIKFILLIPFFFALIYEVYLLLKYFIDRRLIFILQALLEKTEEQDKKEK